MAVISLVMDAMGKTASGFLLNKTCWVSWSTTKATLERRSSGSGVPCKPARCPKETRAGAVSCFTEERCGTALPDRLAFFLAPALAGRVFCASRSVEDLTVFLGLVEPCWADLPDGLCGSALCACATPSAMTRAQQATRVKPRRTIASSRILLLPGPFQAHAWQSQKCRRSPKIKQYQTLGKCCSTVT